MKVLQYETNNGIKHFPIDIRMKNDKVVKIKGCTSYHDFNTITQSELAKRNNTKRPMVAGDTHHIHRLDVDDMTLFDKLKVPVGDTPYYLSRNKRLPHYFVKITNLPAKMNKIAVKVGEKHCADILCGQWAWYKYDEQVINGDNEIIELDYADICKVTPTTQPAAKPKPDFSVDRITKALGCLKQYRVDQYDEWLKVGMILFNTHDSLFDIWQNWSKKSTHYDVSELVKKWSTFDKSILNNNLTLGTLFHMAKEDSPESYTNIKLYSLIDNALSGTDDDVSKLFHDMYKDVLVCAQEEPSLVWFKFDHGLWHRVEGTSAIRKYYSTTICDLFVNLKQSHIDKHKDKSEASEIKLKQIKKVIKSLKTYKSISGFINQSIYLFKDTHFMNKLNNNNYLICFGEHSYDLKTNQWRETTRNDYCSISTGYNKEKVNEKNVPVIQNIIRDIFPNEEVYDYMLSNLAMSISGQNTKETFNIWLGNGANGKSLLSYYLHKVLGEYFAEAPVVLITRASANATQANPELARLRYSRMVIFSEPEAGSKLNNSLMKSMSGNDSISARELYGKPFEFVPKFTSFILCNQFELQDSSGDAIPRRLIFTKFKSSFVYEPKHAHQKLRDDTLKDAEVTNKLKGAFMWLLLQRWKELSEVNFKYAMPAVMKADKQEFLNNSDVVKQFITETVEVTDDTKDYVQIKDLYAMFKAYCSETNEKAIKMKDFLARCKKELPEFKDRMKKNGKTIRNAFLKCKMANVFENEPSCDLDLFD